MVGSKRAVLTNIDGSQPGSAALVSQPRLTLQPSDARPFIVVFTEGEDGCTDPLAACELVERSMAEAFPQYVSTTAGNARAQFIAWRGAQDALADGTTVAYLSSPELWS